MMTLFFADHDVIDYETAKRADHERFAKFFHAMLANGVYLPPSGYEAWFISFAHDQSDLDMTLEAAKKAFRQLA